ncbi:MAG: hypothetical protein M3418_11200 [Gemmatimonadota bacterium]|nr:hypothetical protein [Gemmatimonadota bacterium]
METSVEEVRASLPLEQRREFDGAIQLIAFDAMDVQGMMAAVFAGGEAPNPDQFATEAKARLQGKTGKQVLAMADSIRGEQETRDRTQGIAKIAELEERRQETIEARVKLQQFEVVRSRFWKERDYFGSLEPRIRLTVRNGTGHPISRAYFQGTIASPGRSVPWLVEDFNYSIRGGLEPGEEATWNLAPNQFSEWGTTNVPSEAVFTVEVTRLDGPDGEALFSTFGFDSDDQVQLDALRARYRTSGE